MLRLLLGAAFVMGGGLLGWGQETKESRSEIFSGPQEGETLAALPVKGVYGDEAGKTWNLLETGKEQPKLLVFLHKRTRPSFGLARTLMTYVGQRKDDKLTGGIILLTDDATETENWLAQVKQYFNETKRMPVVYSPDGVEGPGAYGLNRNVTMTILIADKNKVTANFALVQPSLQSDLPKILKAAIAVAGGEMPKLSDLEPKAMGGRRQPAPGKLAALLRRFIQKDATDDQVKKLAEEIEIYIKDKPAAQKELGDIISRIQSAKRLSNYGTAKAQEHLREWGKKYGPKESAPPTRE